MNNNKSKTKSWFFADLNPKDHMKPFKHITESEAKCHRLENCNIKYKQRLIDSQRALSNVTLS